MNDVVTEMVNRRLAFVVKVGRMARALFTDYPCRVCDKVYRHKRSARRHMHLAHKVDYRTSILLIWWLRAHPPMKVTGRIK